MSPVSRGPVSRLSAFSVIFSILVHTLLSDWSQLEIMATSEVTLNSSETQPKVRNKKCNYVYLINVLVLSVNFQKIELELWIEKKYILSQGSLTDMKDILSNCKNRDRVFEIVWFTQLCIGTLNSSFEVDTSTLTSTFYVTAVFSIANKVKVQSLNLNINR